MSFYLDASLIMATLQEESSSRAAEAFLRAADQPLFVSELAAAEVASSFSRLVRMNALTTAAATLRLSDFDIWRAALTVHAPVEGADLTVASSLVRRFELRLRAPDAVHLAVCRRGDHELVTLDRGLADAASTIGVRASVLA